MAHRERALRARSAAEHVSRAAPPAGPVTSNAALVRPLQRSAAAEPDDLAHGDLAPVTASAIAAEVGRGEPLGAGVRADMEAAFGADLSLVRVHTGARADEFNRSIAAEAFTTGNDVFFGAGRYKPDDAGGKELLAHELAHVVQQSAGASAGPSRVSSPHDRDEVAARAAAARVVAGRAGNGEITGLLAPAGEATVARNGAPAPAPPAAGGHFAKAGSVPAYIALIREAEARLAAAGHTSIDDRIRILSGLYYGTSWSVDHDVERSGVRDVAFQIYTARPGEGTDPREILGSSLVRALKQSQDVAGIDMGHVMIGLNARSSTASRAVTIPSQGATGLEITTWVGDLGGATARLAQDRVHNPQAAAGRYFTGTDYGASSNIAGDIAGYVIAAAPATRAQEPQWPASDSIADALNGYFASKVAMANGSWQFLVMQGAEFTGRALANRDVVEARMAAKFVSFGRWYLANFMRQRGTLTAEDFLTAQNHLDEAGAVIATMFVDKLLAKLPPTMPSAPEKGVLERIGDFLGL